jgi:hypothetical protein
MSFNRFMPTLDLSTKQTFLVYQQPIVEQERIKLFRKHLVGSKNASKSKMFQTEVKSNNGQINEEANKEQSGTQFQP